MHDADAGVEIAFRDVVWTDFQGSVQQKVSAREQNEEILLFPVHDVRKQVVEMKKTGVEHWSLQK